MRYEIEYYEKPSGRAPVLEFLLDLGRKNKKLTAQVLQDIDHLKIVGKELIEPDCKHMGNGLYELRSRSGSNIARVFYFFFYEGKIVLTNGFVKKTQKTPPRELEKARRYKKDYEVNHD